MSHEEEDKDMKRDKIVQTTVLWSLASALASALVVVGIQAASAGQESPKLEVLLSQELADMEERDMSVIYLEYPPGTGTDAHRHPAHTVVYVISGQVESSLDDSAPVIYGAGESWYESPMQLHATFRNPSETETFKAIAVMVRDTSKPITIMEDAR